MKLLLCNFFQTKRKWLLLGIYKPPKQNKSEFFRDYEHLLNDYTDTLTVENPQLNGFMQLHGVPHLINEPACFQSHDPTGIDNILTKRKKNV